MRALVQSVATGTLPTELAPELQLDDLTDLAIRHRVVGSLGAALRAERLDLPSRLRTALAAATTDHLRVMRSLARIAPVMSDAGIDWAVVKGPVLAARWPDPATARSYQDLDLLVAPHQLRSAIEVLGRLGFRHRNSNWTGFRTLGVGELPLDDGETVIDLHWHLVGLGTNRTHLRLPTVQLLQRAVAVHLPTTTVPTLAPADTLVHLCVHDAIAGARQLVELRDVHLVLAEVDPQVVRAALSDAGAQRLASATLERAQRLFGTPGPGSAATQLTGVRAWILLNRAVDALWASGRGSSWTPYPGAVAGAGRPTARATATALVERLGTSAAARLGRPTVVTPGGPLDWSVDAGGDAERERYLDDVEAGRFGS